MLAIDIFGHRYDPAISSFLNCGDRFWWHRPTGRILDKASITTFVNTYSLTPGPNEFGAAPEGFEQNYPGLPIIFVPAITQPTGLPITGDAGGTQTTVIGVTLNNPLSASATATVNYNIGGGVVPFTVDLAEGDTESQVITKIVAAPEWAVGTMSAEAGVSQIIVTPDDGVTISALTLAIV